jgi:hypothetical protein
VNLAAVRIVKLLPAFLIRLIDKSCAIRRAGGQVFSCHEQAPAHRRSAGATRGLAFHTELPKTLRTIPTYSVYGTIARLLRASPESGLFLMA